MVPTVVPDNVDYMAIAMEEKARIRDKMPSAILNATFGSGPNGDGAQKMPNNAELDIFAAARRGRVDGIRDLIESGRASATDRDDDGITPLHLAVITGRVPMCTYLIEKGAEINAFGGSVPATPLQWAARKGLVEVIDVLIQHGANPRLVDPQDFSCLHSVTHSSDHWALLYILCQPDIAVDERDSMGLTPLHWAALQGNAVAVEVLLKFGANPNLVDRNGLTALHWAASGGNWSCILQLLEAGADVRAMNRDHRKAQDMADRYNNRRSWDGAVEERGLKADGTRVRRPLSEVCGPPGL